MRRRPRACSAKQRSKPRCVKVVEEDAADAAHLVAMLEEEVAVAPGLELRMQRVAERRERVATGAMEVDRVVVVAVRRRQVHAAAEPPDVGGTSRRARATKKRTFRWTVGACGLRGWMTSDTPIASKPRPASSGRVCGRGRRHARAVHVREADAGRARTRRRPRGCRSRRRRRAPRRRLASSGLRAKRPPSTASSASTMRRCRPRR